MKKNFLLALFLCVTFYSHAVERIVSISGTTSEMLCALGLESQIVGVDITSNYPASLRAKAQVGHNRNISAEGIIALGPTIVVGISDNLNPRLAETLKSAGIKTAFFKHSYTPEGVRLILSGLAKACGASAKLPSLSRQFDTEMAGLKIKPNGKKVLFIYARGTGTMMVSGSGTPIDRVITLAGGRNAVEGFSDYKPLTAEALIAANPDVILLFDSGLQSLRGAEGLLKVPDVTETNAGRSKKIVSMDGELLSAFSLRLPQAIKQLNQKLL